MIHDSEPPSLLPSPGPRELTHSLNNLLTIVMARAECSLVSGDPEEMRQALESILEASHAMAENVRNYARTHSARVAPQALSQPIQPLQRP